MNEGQLESDEYRMGRAYERALQALDRRDGRLVHAEALKRIEALIEAESGTPEGEELELLVRLVEFYERNIIPEGRGSR